MDKSLQKGILSTLTHPAKSPAWLQKNSKVSNERSKPLQSARCSWASSQGRSNFNNERKYAEKVNDFPSAEATWTSSLWKVARNSAFLKASITATMISVRPASPLKWSNGLDDIRLVNSLVSKKDGVRINVCARYDLPLGILASCMHYFYGCWGCLWIHDHKSWILYVWRRRFCLLLFFDLFSGEIVSGWNEQSSLVYLCCILFYLLIFTPFIVAPSHNAPTPRIPSSFKSNICILKYICQSMP